MNMAAAQPARAYTHTCEPLVACVIERKGPPLQFIQQTTNNPCGGRVCVSLTSQKKSSRGGGGASLMYNIPSPTEPCRRTDKKRHGPSRPSESGVEWVYQKHTRTKKKSRVPAAASQQATGRRRGKMVGHFVSPTTIYCRLAAM